MSMTGMSSWIGYTRLHEAHFKPAPFLTSVTGVWQLGHTSISSSSGLTGMRGIYDTRRHLWNNLPMKLFVTLLVAAAVLGDAIGAEAQQSRPPAGAAPA